MKDLLIGLLLGYLLGSHITGSTALAELEGYDLIGITRALEKIATAITGIP
ncbi:MAG: hypothetical protein ACYSTI_14445 [Planctomycetota bacterium]|jgi:hypothetical protein